MREINMTDSNRVIKFRAWDKEKKRMITNPNEGICIYLNGSISDKKGWANVDLTLMQYTGLKDKNNKVIFEGDIVKSKKHISVVSWNNKMAQFELEGEFSITYKGWEIIGNIHSNPELLK